MGSTSMIKGVRDFAGQRLHLLQIGLGTFGTFLQHLTDEHERYPFLSWLLEAASDSSLLLRAVGVEPLPEHIASLEPLLESLPNVALVQAAVGSENTDSSLYRVVPEVYLQCRESLKPEQIEAFDASVLYLKNMSCVGQVHPIFEPCISAIKDEFGVSFEMEPVLVPSVTFGTLLEMVNTCGTEVLIIDAEGHDCHILRSMIHDCIHKRPGAWPDVIQFESFGHCDVIEGIGAESEMMHTLQGLGYCVVYHGNDTVLVRRNAVVHGSAVDRWVQSIRCFYCGDWGLDCMPRTLIWKELELHCEACGQVASAGFWLLQFLKTWQLLPNNVCVKQVCANSTSLWGLSVDNTLHSLRGDEPWVSLDCGVSTIAMTVSNDIFWIVNDRGEVLTFKTHSTRALSALPMECPMQQVVVASDGDIVFGVGTNGDIYKYTCGLQRWSYICGSVERLAVSNDCRSMWAVNSSARIYHSSDQGHTWQHVSGSLRDIIVSRDGKHVWGLDWRGTLYYRNGLHYGWVEIGGELESIATSVDGWQLWGVDKKGQAWTCVSN